MTEAVAPKVLYVLSDATAETAERVLRAALIQFREARPQIRIFSLLRKDEQIEDALKQALHDRALVVYTIVNPEQRELLETRFIETNNAASNTPPAGKPSGSPK